MVTDLCQRTIGMFVGFNGIKVYILLSSYTIYIYAEISVDDLCIHTLIFNFWE